LAVWILSDGEKLPAWVAKRLMLPAMPISGTMRQPARLDGKGAGIDISKGDCELMGSNGRFLAPHQRVIIRLDSFSKIWRSEAYPIVKTKKSDH
jgi:hypothetical protein